MASKAPSSTSPTPSDESPSSIAKNRHAQKYSLRVTAGTSYDTTTHVVVPVNAPQTLHLNSPHMLLSVAVRIKHFTGIPTTSPPTSPYFDHPLHKSDQYSISFSFIPKVDIAGNDLIFGNDFDRPIRDRLPPGFNQAFRIAKWFIDPGLEGDPYSDKPYLYGPALSSWNILRIGEKIYPPEKESENENENEKQDGEETAPPKAQTKPDTSADAEAWQLPNADTFHSTVVEEGSSGTGTVLRTSLSIPPDASGRKKHFLTEAHRAAFTFEAGRLHQSDFGNPFLDFNDFSLKLPGFSLNVIKYVDEKTHELRYVLKNRSTDDVYAVVLLSLLFGDERDEGGVGLTKDYASREETEERDNGEDGSRPERVGARKGSEGEFGYEKPPDEDDVD